MYTAYSTYYTDIKFICVNFTSLYYRAIVTGHKNRILMIAESKQYFSHAQSLALRTLRINFGQALLGDDRVRSRSGPENRHVRATMESIFS